MESVNYGFIVGWLKFRVQRMSTYIGVLNFLMLLYTTARNRPMGLTFEVVLALGLLVAACLSLFDYFVVFPNEIRAKVREDPWMFEMSKDLKACRTMLEERK